jgi:WD40 repeat protein
MSQATPIAPAATITLPADITSLGAITGAASVAAGLADGGVVVWNGRDANPSFTWKPHGARVLTVGSSADGREVWSFAADGSLSRTALATAASSASRRVDLGPAPVRAAALSADGGVLATGGEFGEIRIYDSASGALKRPLRGHRTELQSLAFGPGAKVLASASAESDLKIWEVASGRPIKTVDGDLSHFAVAFNLRDGTLAAGGVDRRVTLREPRKFDAVGELTLHKPQMVGSLACSPDGRLIAVGDIDDESLSKGTIHIVDAATLVVASRLDTRSVPAAAVVFAAGRTVVAALRRELRAWTV